MSRSTSLLKRDERAVSEIVGEVLLVGIIVAAIAVGARVYLGSQSPPSRFVLFSVQVEENTEEDIFKVKLTIKHVGGNPILNPAKYLAVWGAVDRMGVEESRAYENDNENRKIFGFSWYQENYGKFELGNVATLYIQRYGVPEDRYRVVPGDRYRIRIYDNYSEKVLYEKVLTVVASS